LNPSLLTFTGLYAIIKSQDSFQIYLSKVSRGIAEEVLAAAISLGLRICMVSLTYITTGAATPNKCAKMKQLPPRGKLSRGKFRKISYKIIVIGVHYCAFKIKFTNC
jgi:hypothetical protein